jgi:hypothetical protein
MNAEDFALALNVFSRRPGLDFVRGLRLSLERDPGYLNAHRDAIILGVKEILNNAGVFWEKSSLNENALELIRQAVGRLEHIEKAGSSV